MRHGFTVIVPVQTVIVDEASQIEVGDYLPILGKYKTSLRKIVFIGDDKQRECWGEREMRLYANDPSIQWLLTEKKTFRN